MLDRGNESQRPGVWKRLLSWHEVYRICSLKMELINRLNPAVTFTRHLHANVMLLPCRIQLIELNSNLA